MKSTVVFVLTWLISFTALAQFQFKKSIGLTSAAQYVQWADLNNDSLLDAVITLKRNNYYQLIAVNQITTDTAKTFIIADSISTTGEPLFLDWDSDNKIDIVFPQAESSNTLIVKNLGNFAFKKISGSVGNAPYSQIQFADLNNDARPDAVLIKKSGGWSVFKNNQGQFTVMIDSADQVEDFALFDFDGNGYRDLAACGILQNGQPFLSVYEFIDNFQLARKIPVPGPIFGKIEIGDVNADGFFDLLLSGKDANGQLNSVVYINNQSTFTATKKYSGLLNPELRIADLDTDGHADLSFFGSDGQGVLRNWISSASGDSVSLPTQHLTHQAFGDVDRDGDLDLLLSTDTLSVIVLENTTVVKNYGPATPTHSLGIFILNRYFMYWDQSIDDHTPSASVTYDLMLKASQQEVEAGEFDLKNLERLTVTHGNHGTNNFALQRIPITTYSYAIQPIDNSFTVRNTLVGGGQGGGGCANLDSQTLTSCHDAPIQLPAKQAALWFSFSKGYLGKSDSLSVPAKTDTVFSYIPAKQFSCDDLKVYLIQQSAKDTLKVNNDFIACLGDTTWLTVDPQWSGVIWKDDKGAQKGTGDSLHYIVNKKESLTAVGHNNRGCLIKETENLTASKPSLTLNGEDFKIMLGQSVSLSASGAREYWWQPADGLNNNTIANPVASPAKTTTYTLIGFDSLHCTAMATVLVEVTPTAFIPTLFTPNGDGKNEELKIYGLTDARNFQFTIYNREGIVMYETADIGNALSSGWNGTKNGTPQPPGLYYWKVDGYFDSGQHLMLNGKTKGSIMLIR